MVGADGVEVGVNRVMVVQLVGGEGEEEAAGTGGNRVMVETGPGEEVAEDGIGEEEGNEDADEEDGGGGGEEEGEEEGVGRTRTTEPPPNPRVRRKGRAFRRPPRCHVRMKNSLREGAPCCPRSPTPINRVIH